MPLYKDFHLSFDADSLTRDLKTVEDEEAVIQSIKNLVLTVFFERPFQPSLGSGVYNLLFEPLDDVIQILIAQQIKDVVSRFEPRATVKFVDMYTETGPNGEKLGDHDLVIVVGFTVFNLPTLVTSEFILRRLR